MLKNKKIAPVFQGRQGGFFGKSALRCVSWTNLSNGETTVVPTHAKENRRGNENFSRTARRSQSVKAIGRSVPV
jgi:hypothetical protein